MMSSTCFFVSPMQSFLDDHQNNFDSEEIETNRLWMTISKEPSDSVALQPKISQEEEIIDTTQLLDEVKRMHCDSMTHMEKLGFVLGVLQMIPIVTFIIMGIVGWIFLR